MKKTKNQSSKEVRFVIFHFYCFIARVVGEADNSCFYIIFFYLYFVFFAHNYGLPHSVPCPKLRENPLCVTPAVACIQPNWLDTRSRRPKKQIAQGATGGGILRNLHRKDRDKWLREVIIFKNSLAGTNVQGRFQISKQSKGLFILSQLFFVMCVYISVVLLLSWPKRS